MVDPAAHGFIGNDDPALSQRIFHVAEAKGEPKIQPNRQLNDLGGKAVATLIYLLVNGYRQDEEIANPEQCEKAVMRIEATGRLDKFGRGRGGFWPDRGYEWYAGI